MVAIAGGVAQTVDVIDAQPVDQPLAIEPQDGGVDHVENARVLDPQAGKLGNVEEATPVDHVASNPPPGQPEMLALHQRHAGSAGRDAHRAQPQADPPSRR